MKRTRFALLALIFLPALAHAYAGPGAGFAVLSSFWAIFVAFLYSFYALMTWPFRQLFRFMRRPCRSVVKNIPTIGVQVHSDCANICEDQDEGVAC